MQKTAPEAASFSLDHVTTCNFLSTFQTCFNLQPFHIDIRQMAQATATTKPLFAAEIAVPIPASLHVHFGRAEFVRGRGTGTNHTQAKYAARLEAVRTLHASLQHAGALLPKALQKRFDEAELATLDPNEVHDPKPPESRFKSFNEAATFLQNVFTKCCIPIPSVAWLIPTMGREGRILPDEDSFVKASLKFVLPATHTLSQRDETVHGAAQEASITEAKVAARLDAANKAHSLLATPEAFRSTAGCNAEEQPHRPTANFSLGDEARRTIADFVAMHEASFMEVAPLSASCIEDENETEETRSQKNSPSQSNASLVHKLAPFPRNTLPIHAFYHDVVHSIQANDVTIVTGATGSGKTTQLPQFLLHHFASVRASKLAGRPPRILMTQPRRIAATSCAERIAHELGQRLGVNAAVGYAVRFAAVRATRLAGGTVHVCTPGVLLRRLLHTPLLGGVSHVIVDEVHCRDVFSDVVLLAMKRVLRQRRGSLRLVLMSATAGVERLKKFFEEDGFLVGAPFAVQGTAFPVRRLHLEEIVTLPAKSSAACENALERESLQFVESEMLGTEDSLGITPFFLIMQLLRHIVTREPGSGAILIFLPGIEEISTLHELLLKETEIAFGDASKYAIYTLHSSLPTAASLFVRAAAGVRKIVLSTNIAESSVTVPDVEFVVDTARHKVLRFSHAKRLSVLATEWISKTNVRQRMGRAGRCQPGVYFLLASRERADAFSDDVTPEILLESLDATVLTAKRLFPAQSIHTTASALLDAPPADSLQMALERLQTLKVLDGELQLTRLGSVLSNFPLLPAFSKLVVLGCVFRCLDPMLTMAATANEKLFAVRYDAADKQHTLSVVQTIASDLDGVHPFSDHMIACEIVTRFSNIASEGARIDFCRSHSLQYATLSRVLQIKRSLRQLLCSVGLLRPNDAECGATAEVNRFAGNTQLVRALLLMSLYPDVAWRSAVKRNHFKTKGVSYGAVPSTSGCYHVGSGSLAALQKSVSAECAKKMQGKSAQDFPATYVFDSAIDTGNDRPLFTRVTAIDPAMLLLACNAESVFAMRPDADALKIDDWLALCGARPDAMLLVALGQLMQRFVEHKLATLLGENAQGSLSKSPVEHENAFLEALDLLFKKVFNAS